MLKFLEIKKIYLVIIFLIITLPLWDLPPYFFPGDWSRGVVFRSLMAILIFIIFLRKEVVSQQIKEFFKKNNPAFITLIFLLVYYFIILLSVLFSLNIQRSLWDTPERGDGFVNFSFFIIFCFLNLFLIKEKDWKKILNFCLVVGLLVTLTALSQQLGLLKNIFLSIPQRPFGTLGNPIILSLYLLLLTFIALGFSIFEKNKIKKYLYFTSFIFFVFSIVFITQTRAAILGLGVGLVWFIFFYPLKSEYLKKVNFLKLSFIFLLILAFFSLLFLKNHPSFYEKWPLIVKNFLERMFDLLEGSKRDLSRFYVWKMALKAFQERPLLGYGPWNFSIAYYKHYFPYIPDIKNLNFDRAHNSLIEILIGSGIFALIFYLLFFFFLLWQLQKIKKENFIAHSLQSSFIAYFTASLASIEGFSIYLLFYLFVSYSFFLITNQQKREIKENIIKKPQSPFLIFFLFLLLLVFLWQYNLIPFLQNIKINKAELLAKDNKYKEAFDILEKESQKSTILIPHINSIFIKTLVKESIKESEKEAINAKKINEITERNIKLEPLNPENWQKLGQSLLIIAKKENNLELAKKAQESFEKALLLSPQKESFILDAFLSDVLLKDFKKAEERVSFCLKNFPEVSECLWISGLIKIYQNETEDGKKLIEKAKKKGFFSNYSSKEIPLNHLIDAFAENKNYKELVPIYQELIELKPFNPQYKASLAFVYRELKEYQKAREIALKILETNPEMESQVKAFLKTLP